MLISLYSMFVYTESVWRIRPHSSFSCFVSTSSISFLWESSPALTQGGREAVRAGLGWRMVGGVGVEFREFRSFFLVLWFWSLKRRPRPGSAGVGRNGEVFFINKRPDCFKWISFSCPILFPMPNVRISGVKIEIRGGSSLSLWGTVFPGAKL